MLLLYNASSIIAQINIQDWINKYFGIQSQTSAPIIISLGIFTTGFLLNEIVKVISAYNKRSLIRQIFKVNIEELVATISDQGENYKRVASHFEFTDEVQNFTIDIKNLYKISLIKQIGYEQAFNAYLTGIENSVCKFWKKNNWKRKKRIMAFHEIWEAIEFVITAQDEVIKQSSNFVAAHKSLHEELNKSFNDYLIYIKPILMEAKQPDFFNKNNFPEALQHYLTSVNQINNNFAAIRNKQNPYIIQRKLILPLLILKRNFENIPIIEGSYNVLLTVNYKYLDIKKTFCTYRSIFMDFSGKFTDRANKISASYKML